jgi:hypothetical protein
VPGGRQPAGVLGQTAAEDPAAAQGDHRARSASRRCATRYGVMRTYRSAERLRRLRHTLSVLLGVRPSDTAQRLFESLPGTRVDHSDSTATSSGFGTGPSDTDGMAPSAVVQLPMRSRRTVRGSSLSSGLTYSYRPQVSLHPRSLPARPSGGNPVQPCSAIMASPIYENLGRVWQAGPSLASL